jgi:hypothetical protein
VIVGDLIGRGDAQERGVVGETPNLAARLQATAEPNNVVIAASTRRLVGNLFEYRDLGGVAAKGFTEPVEDWQVGFASWQARKFLRSKFAAADTCSHETSAHGQDRRLSWRRTRLLPIAPVLIEGGFASRNALGRQERQGG